MEKFIYVQNRGGNEILFNLRYIKSVQKINGKYTVETCKNDIYSITVSQYHYIIQNLM